MKNTLKLILFLVILSACNTHQPVRTAYNLPEFTELESWSNLKSPQIDSFKILYTGAVKVPLEGMLNIEKLPENHGMDEMIWVDVFAYLFHHKTKGWYLIDTGLDSSFQDNGNIKGLLASNYIKECRQHKGENIGSQLKRENKDIKGIFLTHLHGDHTAGLPEINPRIPKFVGSGEEYLHLPFFYHSNHLSEKDSLEEISWEHAEAIKPLEKVVDIFGDQSFYAISTPGHSNSHTSYLLNTSSGLILLTGDASHTKFGFENNIEPGWITDQQQAENSLSQLISFKKMYPETRVIYGHQK
ncbi:MAG: hypothetical protein CMO01_31035 [Thalassobius sp.]|nr:hypothetical protein [Thalassovita sp.]